MSYKPVRLKETAHAPENAIMVLLYLFTSRRGSISIDSYVICLTQSTTVNNWQSHLSVTQSEHGWRAVSDVVFHPYCARQLERRELHA